MRLGSGEPFSKLSLHGFSREQLREILLIVFGYTTMSRVVFGKIPAKSLKPLTDKAKEGPPHKILELLRFCRLMSMAEMVAVFERLIPLRNTLESCFAFTMLPLL